MIEGSFQNFKASNIIDGKMCRSAKKEDFFIVVQHLEVCFFKKLTAFLVFTWIWMSPCVCILEALLMHSHWTMIFTRGELMISFFLYHFQLLVIISMVSSPFIPFFIILLMFFLLTFTSVTGDLFVYFSDMHCRVQVRLN